MLLPLRRSTAVLAASLAALGACGSDERDATPTGPTKTIEIAATEYSFTGDPGSLVAGDRVQFVVDNVGQLIHELQVLDAEGRVLGVTSEIPPGGRDQVTVALDEPGTYQLICDVDDHFSRGQRAAITVAAP